MNEAQREEIRQLIERFAQPATYHNKVRRPALLCAARSDGSLMITPNFVQKIEAKSIT